MMNSELKRKIGIGITASLTILAIFVAAYLLIENYIENRDYKGIEKHVKIAYDDYQSGALVDHMQVSQDCMITVKHNGYDSSCFLDRNQENIDCQLKAIGDGYDIASGKVDQIVDKTECKIR